MLYILTLFHLKNNIRNYSQYIYISIFYILSISFYGYSLTQNAQAMAAVSLPVIWINYMFTQLLGLPQFYEADEQDGWLEQWVIFPYSFEGIVVSKMLAQWITLNLPLLILTPGLLLLLEVPLGAIWSATGALMLASIPMLCIGALGAALMTGMRQRTPFLLLIVMPIYLPVLLLGVTASQPENIHAADAWLGLLGMAIMAGPLCVYATRFLLKDN